MSFGQTARIFGRAAYILVLLLGVDPTKELGGAEPFAEGERILVLAPHPDDEVLGCGGIIERAMARGIPLRVVFLTWRTGSR